MTIFPINLFENKNSRRNDLTVVIKVDFTKPT